MEIVDHDDQARGGEAAVRPAMPLLIVGTFVLAACRKEAHRDDIQAALQACDIRNARIERRVPDGTQSDFQVDFGTTASGHEDSDCMNVHLRAAGLKSVLTFFQAAPKRSQGAQ